MPKLPKFLVTSLAAAATFWGGISVQAQPTISNVYPDGTAMFQLAPSLTFNADSTVDITNVTVDLTSTSLQTGQAILKSLSLGKGLTVAGANNSMTVSATLKSNLLYAATIQIKDASGAVASQTINFDTINPAYTWEAEDWDYTLNGIPGQFIDNPQTNAYAGLLTTDYVDAHNANGQSAYRPGGDANPGGLATEGCGDLARRPYLGSGKLDYDVGWTDGGDFGNYTRHFPAGTYNLYVRAAGGGGVKTESADITVYSGNAYFTGSGSAPYKYGVKGRGWQSYDFMPVTDSSGNLAEITFDGNPATLQFLQNQGGDNINFFMLLPLQPAEVSTVTITNVYPDGTLQFQATNLLSFDASSPVAIDPANDVSVQLAGTNLFGQGSVASLTTANGLAVAGTSTDVHVMAPLASNMVYTALIQVSDANGVAASYSVSFDTITPAYTFEAEDFNYGGGNFIDNPQVDAYSGLDGVAEIDFHKNNTGGNSGYNRIGLPGEGCGDVPRASQGGNPDYDLGNTAAGNWGDYTRTFPSGTYNIFVRVSRGDGGAQLNAGKISVVTGVRTQMDQTTQDLGAHDTPATGGWQKYVWVPIMNSGGYPARFMADGSVKTLRYTFVGAGENVGFFMLVPADLTVNPPPYVSDFAPDGQSLFQFTNKLAFVANSSVGIATNNITLNIDGANVSGLSFSGSSTAWNVTCPVTTNGFHTVIVKLVDGAGTTYYTNKFDTFAPDTYTFEAEDYDFTYDGINGGQFFDNPQTDMYQGLGSVLNVDNYWNYNVGAGYRTSSGAGDGLATEAPCSDWVRPQYTSGNFQTYNIGHNDGGNWANYTRTQPAGTYNIWMRMASPNGSPWTVDAAKVSLVTNGWGTTSQATKVLGTFTTPNTGGWGAYGGGWAPLIDANCNYVKWTANGSTNTLKVTVDNGGYNVDFFALVPADNSKPTLGNLYPNGLMQFQGTNVLSFDASSGAGITTNSIMVTLNGVVVTNLVITGSSTNWHVSYTNLQPDSIYTANISFSGVAGGVYNTSYSFDTYSSTNYQWEAEDWDYTSGGVSGLFYDNPQVNAYANQTSTEGIDVSQSNTNALLNPFDYRAYDNINLTPAQEPSGDLARPQFTAGKTDYKLDWFGYGSWCNYTRHYPAGTYNIVGRFTEGSAVTVATLSEVTSGFGTASQTTTPLGTFNIPLGSWNSSESVYLRDDNGNLVSVVFDGSQTTLRLSGNPIALNDPTINVNYFMLVPAKPGTATITLSATLKTENIIVSFPTQSGLSYQLLYKDNLSDATWTPLGNAVTGDNTVKSVLDSATNTHRFYRVSAQ